MQRTTYKKPIFLLIFISVFTVLFAQEENHSPAAIEQMKINRLWQQTSNAAGLKIEQPKDYSVIAGNYRMENGDFHRVMNGNKKNNLILDTEGGVNVGNTYFWGRFNYSREAIKDAKFNASLIDPYRGMPYFVADTNSSNWNNQYYELEFKINFPTIGDKISIGIGGEYHAYTGAKQRDIRTENAYMKLALRPGLVYLINKNHRFGFNLEYFSLKEESHMSNVNVYIDQPYYELYGLGRATIGIGSGRETNYVGNSIGGGLQYHYSGIADLLLTSNFSTKVEDTQISFSTPKSEGTIIDAVWHSKALLKTKSIENTHYIDLEYLQRHIKGIEYISKYDDSDSFKGYVNLKKNIRSKYANRLLSAGYSWTNNWRNEYRTRLGGKIKFIEYKNKYILPQSDRMAKNMAFEVFGKHNIILSDALAQRLLIGANCTYEKNIDGNYLYGGAFKEYPINSQLEKRDNEYDSSGYLSAHLSAVYSQKIKRANGLNLFIGTDYIYSKASNKSFGSRNDISLSIGCIF